MKISLSCFYHLICWKICPSFPCIVIVVIFALGSAVGLLVDGAIAIFDSVIGSSPKFILLLRLNK